MKFFKNKKGFTLVELVVVIAILGILAGIAIPRFMDATASARGAKIVADMRTLESAETMYYAQKGEYADMATLAPASGTSNYLAKEPIPPVGTYLIPESNVKGTVAADTKYIVNVVTTTTPATYTITLGTSGPTLATLTTKS